MGAEKNLGYPDALAGQTAEEVRRTEQKRSQQTEDDGHGRRLGPRLPNSFKGAELAKPLSAASNVPALLGGPTAEGANEFTPETDCVDVPTVEMVGVGARKRHQKCHRRKLPQAQKPRSSSRPIMSTACLPITVI